MRVVSCLNSQASMLKLKLVSGDATWLAIPLIWCQNPANIPFCLACTLPISGTFFSSSRFSSTSWSSSSNVSSLARAGICCPASSPFSTPIRMSATWLFLIPTFGKISPSRVFFPRGPPSHVSSPSFLSSWVPQPFVESSTDCPETISGEPLPFPESSTDGPKTDGKAHWAHCKKPILRNRWVSWERFCLEQVFKQQRFTYCLVSTKLRTCLNVLGVCFQHVWMCLTWVSKVATQFKHYQIWNLNTKNIRFVTGPVDNMFQTINRDGREASLGNRLVAILLISQEDPTSTRWELVVTWPVTDLPSGYD